MHIVFAVSALVMGIATIWMMAADHSREWKNWQLKDRKKDAWMLASRRDALAETYSRRMADYDAEIRRLDSLDIAPGIVEAFVQRIAKQERLMRAAASGTATQETTAGDAPIDEARFARLSARVDVLRDAAARAAEARAAAADAGTAGDALKAEAAAGDHGERPAALPPQD
ncbi:MAG TPA: hypothetical protein PKC18_18985, partial [Lacipirellulaceae bacterium]|nr:hypothetical protein [Lacipirellulaceae bacterium]